ncbi:MAG: LytR family transcriptional regulator [Cyanobacteria bacterium SIG31]|nr:LytR family transcriptional regulator [Cyanobacteria bacterium SIG31]
MKVVNSQQEEYKAFLRNIREEREESSSLVKLIFTVIIAILCAVIVCVILVENSTLLNSAGRKMAEDTTGIFKHSREQKRTFDMSFSPRRQNILILGVDSNGEDTDMWKGTRSDTILVVNIDPKTHSIKAISIPRDSKVYLPDNKGVQKINSAHALGGVNLVKKTLKETFGIRIDRYVLIHDEAVEKIVDALGGIPIYVEKKMLYHDYAGKLHIDLEKGNTILNGKQAVGYLRYRKDGLGDIGRTHRQQWFMKSLFDRLHSPQVITKIPEVLNVANTYIKTDMSFYELSQYAAMARSIDKNKVEIATLPGAPNQRGYISYWILDPVKTQEVINRMIYRDKPVLAEGMKFKAGIMYSPKREADAEAIKQKLDELGFEANMLKITHLSHTRFVANKNGVTMEFFNWLQKKMPELHDMQFIYDPTEMFSVSSDFTIVLAEQ